MTVSRMSSRPPVKILDQGGAGRRRALGRLEVGIEAQWCGNSAGHPVDDRQQQDLVALVIGDVPVLAGVGDEAGVSATRKTPKVVRRQQRRREGGAENSGHGDKGGLEPEHDENPYEIRAVAAGGEGNFEGRRGAK